jgi:hypothetical protein
MSHIRARYASHLIFPNFWTLILGVKIVGNLWCYTPSSSFGPDALCRHFVRCSLGRTVQRTQPHKLAGRSRTVWCSFVRNSSRPVHTYALVMCLQVRNYWHKTGRITTTNSVIWDISPCSPVKVNRRFEETCRLHLHGRRVSQGRNRHEASRKQSRPAC